MECTMCQAKHWEYEDDIASPCPKHQFNERNQCIHTKIVQDDNRTNTDKHLGAKC